MLNHFHCFDHETWSRLLKGKGLRLLEYRYYLSQAQTCQWDKLAAQVFFLKPLVFLFPSIHRALCRGLGRYYTDDTTIGAGVLLVAQKE